MIRKLLVALFLSAVSIVELAWSAPPAEVGVAIGGVVPAWEGLQGTDGKKHALADLECSKAVVIIFYANHCPDCDTYLPRILAIAKEYDAKKVQTVLISVSHNKEDDLDAMIAFAKKHELSGLYLQDLSQKTAKQLGADCTPAAFLLDGKRRLVYKGAIDDHWKEAKVKRQHLRLAIDQTLAGTKVEVPETEAVGCSIEFED